jgi:UDP-GlcNAc:undecaprenyl-phosphate/decaprenyl-phosphate GlcNAc-1-phosphate transferase
MTLAADPRLLLLAAGLSLVTTLALIPLVKRVAFSLGYVSRPRDDRWISASQPKALFGGVAILAGFWIALLVTTSGLTTWHWRILLAGNIAFGLIGFLDDLLEFRPATKVLCQVVASLLPIAFGLSIPGLNPVAGQLIAMAWIVVVVNAVNLLDNMDGLASGVAAIAASVLAFQGMQSGNVPLVLAAIALAGSCVGFLGYTLAVLTLLDVAKSRTTILTAIAGPALVLLVPIFDTALVALSRFAHGRPVTAGAADHSSHRLVSLGLTERQTAVLLYALSFGGGLASLALSRFSLALMSVCMLLLLVTAYYFGNFLSRVPVYARTAEGVAAAQSRRLAVFNAFIPYKWPLLDLLADICVIVGAHVAAYLLRFEGHLDDANLRLLSWSLPIVLASRLVFFQILGLYRRVWGHFSVSDVLSIGKAVLGSSATAVTIIAIGFKFYGFSRAVVIIDAALTFGLVVMGHASLSVFSELFRGRRGAVRTLIVGAGDLGSAAARLLRSDPDGARLILGYLDDDQAKIGRRLQGVIVDGPIERLEEIATRERADEVVIAVSRLPEERTTSIRAACDRLGVSVRRVSIE